MVVGSMSSNIYLTDLKTVDHVNFTRGIKLLCHSASRPPGPTVLLQGKWLEMVQNETFSCLPIDTVGPFSEILRQKLLIEGDLE